jgi:hypothetical protein
MLLPKLRIYPNVVSTGTAGAVIELDTPIAFASVGHVVGHRHASIVLYGNDALQNDRGGPRSVGVALYVPPIRHGRGRQASGAGRQVRQGGVRPQKRAPDYQLIAAWSGFLLFIGAGAFAPGMAIHNETLAAQHPPHPEPVYYCATGVEMPLFEPCKEMKGQRDI